MLDGCGNGYQGRKSTPVSSRLTVVLATAGLLVAACDGARPGEEAAPTPVSPIVGNFVPQTDGDFGYRMLRPQGWEAVDLGDRRLYSAPGPAGSPDRLTLSVTNVRAAGEAAQASGGMLAQFAAFEQNPSLEGWTGGVERTWASLGLTFKPVEEDLPEVKVYRVISPGSADLRLVAYAVDEGIPLAVALAGSGAYADLGRLGEEGVTADFLAMLRSLEAVPVDAGNVEPVIKDR